MIISRGKERVHETHLTLGRFVGRHVIFESLKVLSGDQADVGLFVS